LESPNQPWRIYLPDAILLQAIKWYHYALSPIGRCCLADTMSMTFYNPKLRNVIEAVLTPRKECQKYKNVQQGQGIITPRQTGLLPWSEIAINTIGPWTLDDNRSSNQSC
jgi:hypothetical protein